MLNNQEWFTEFSPTLGLGFGLKIKSQLHQEKTPYQSITIYETTQFGNLMVIDGCIMLTGHDCFFYHEMMSHPALFSHPQPQDVIIIGGGDCGTLLEVLKHPIRSVKQIEIDERVTQLAEIYFPELCQSNNDNRAQLLFVDALQWLKAAPDNSADIIIIDATDPLGPKKGLFNQAFYEQCYRVLTENGILIQQSESPLLQQKLLKEMRSTMQLADFGDLLTLAFPQPVYPSGWWSSTLAAKKTTLSQFRRDIPLLKQLQTKYYQFALHEAALTPFPFLQKMLVK